MIKVEYAAVSPYSGLLMHVTEYEDAPPVRSPVVPLVFRPDYATPLQEGEPVPY